MSSVLSVKNATMKFGGLTAVDNLSIEIPEHSLTGLIGPNGAGKTTIFNMITGIYPPTMGEIYLNGESLKDIAVPFITQKGIARTFQNIRLFKDLTVFDNIRLAGQFRVKYSLFDNIFRNKKFHLEEERLEIEAMKLLKIFSLDQKRDLLARNLPYGEQRRLEIARALATRPKLLLLDEPAAGMNPNETADLTKLIRWVRDEFKISILLIEHDMNLVMNVCEHIYVVDHGVMIASGVPSLVQNDPKVIEAYLGANVEETYD